MLLRRMRNSRTESARRQRSQDRVAACVTPAPCRAGLLNLAVVLLISAVGGCASMSEDDEPGFFGKMASIGGIRGPLERSL